MAVSNIFTMLFASCGASSAKASVAVMMIAASILIIDRFILILLFGWSVLLEIREAICFFANDPKLKEKHRYSL